MDVHHLRYFLAVVDHGSVSGAASGLGVTQPTISQALRSLEADLGTPLFHRIGRGMVPTSAGEALVGSARRVLRGVSAAEGVLPSPGGALRGRLDLLALPALSTGPIPVLVAEFHRRHPGVSVTIGKLRDDESPRAVLRSGRCDVVVTHLPFDDVAPDSPHDPVLTVVEVGSQEFWIAYPADADLPAHDPIRWDELPDVPLVVVPPGGSHAGEILRTMASAGVLRPPAAVLQNREARISFVLSGVGGTFIERSLSGFARARGAQVRAFTPPLSRPYGFVVEPAALSPVAAAFVDLARSRSDEAGTSVPGSSADSRARATNAEAAGES